MYLNIGKRLSKHDLHRRGYYIHAWKLHLEAMPKPHVSLPIKKEGNIMYHKIIIV